MARNPFNDLLHRRGLNQDLSRKTLKMYLDRGLDLAESNPGHPDAVKPGSRLHDWLSTAIADAETEVDVNTLVEVHYGYYIDGGSTSLPTCIYEDNIPRFRLTVYDSEANAVGSVVWDVSMNIEGGAYSVDIPHVDDYARDMIAQAAMDRVEVSLITVYIVSDVFRTDMDDNRSHVGVSVIERDGYIHKGVVIGAEISESEIIEVRERPEELTYYLSPQDAVSSNAARFGAEATLRLLEGDEELGIQPYPQAILAIPFLPPSIKDQLLVAAGEAVHRGDAWGMPLLARLGTSE